MAMIGIEAPENPTKLIEALEDLPKEITPIVFGPKQELEPLESRVKIVDCPTFTRGGTVQERTELRQSSIYQAVKDHSDGLVHAVLALNNTAGAVGAISRVFGKGRRYSQRPCLVTAWPNQGFLVDSGATVECTPQRLAEFAIIGAAYIRALLGKASGPEIGLLTNGEELTKGNRLVKETRKLLEEMKEMGYDISERNFEPHDLSTPNRGYPRLAVCEGHLGNVVLKMAEHCFGFLYADLKSRLSSGGLIDRLAARKLLPKLRAFKQKISGEEYATAPLLGVENANVLVCHSATEPATIRGAIRIANERFGNFEIADYVKTKVEEYQKWKRERSSS